MHLYRTCFDNEIIAEFLPPFDPGTESVSPSASDELIIFLSGMPSVPDQQELVKYYAAHDFWVFLPRYRGSWESGGTFLKNSPVDDVKDLIDALFSEVTEVFGGKHFHPDPASINLIGSSFGGGVALSTANQMDMIDKTIALSPVADWEAEEDILPMRKMKQNVEKGFYKAYRTAENGWSQLADGELFNPIDTAANVAAEDTLIIYSTDDTTVALSPIESYIKESGAQTEVFKDRGHLGSSDATTTPIADIILKFIG